MPALERRKPMSKAGREENTTLPAMIAVGLSGVIIGIWLQSWLRPELPPAQVAASKGPALVSVSDVKLTEPSMEGDPHRMEATLSRSQPGPPVDVIFRLRNKASGQRRERRVSVELQPNTALVVVAEISLPRGDYDLEAEARNEER
jgi:hypothetical protein